MFEYFNNLEFVLMKVFAIIGIISKIQNGTTTHAPYFQVDTFQKPYMDQQIYAFLSDFDKLLRIQIMLAC